MLKYWVFLSCFLSLSFSFSQDNPFRLIRSVSTTSPNFTTDHLGNIYLFGGNTLGLYNGEGQIQKSHSLKQFGEIGSVDASDPMKVLLFYRTFQQIVLLDNQLSPAGNPVSIETLGTGEASLACTSHNNGFWLYTLPNHELIRFDQGLNRTVQTGNLIQTAGLSGDPVFLHEYYDHIFLSDTSSGILIFDLYGAHIKTIPIKGLMSFQVAGEQLIYFKNSKLRSYNLKTLEEDEVLLPENNITNARCEKEKLYLLKQNRLDIYHAKIETQPGR